MEEKNTKQKSIKIDVPENVEDGIYSNLAIIAHSPYEFVCDFVQIMPNAPKAKVQSRVIMTPENAKRLMRALQENIKKYEEKMGGINDSGVNLPPINFGNPPTEA